MLLDILCQKHFPHLTQTEEVMAQSLAYERNYWRNMEIAITNGIAKAFDN